MKPKYIFTEQEKNLIIHLYEMGYGDEEVSRVLGIQRKTLIDRIKQNDLTSTIKNRKGNADKKVEAVLYKKAMEGNMTAIIFWLCNRQSDRWKNLNKVDVSGTIQIPEPVIIKPVEYKDKKGLIDENTKS